MVILSDKVHNVLSAMLTAFDRSCHDEIIDEFSVVDHDTDIDDFISELNGGKNVTISKDPTNSGSYLVYYDTESKCLRHLDNIGKRLVKDLEDFF